jgi:hypothetical protein
LLNRHYHPSLSLSRSLSHSDTCRLHTWLYHQHLPPTLAHSLLTLLYLRLIHACNQMPVNVSCFIPCCKQEAKAKVDRCDA